MSVSQVEQIRSEQYFRFFLRSFSFVFCSLVLLFLALTSNPTEADSSQFALWVAFFEIYNESVYDLLQASLCSKSKKRSSLRVCDDGAGNCYVKGLCTT